MVEKLTVIFIILIFLLVGIYLILSPWNILSGINTWEQNFFLSFLSQRMGLTFIQNAVASNWFRGAVTGLGVLNIFIAFWESAHFNQSVEMLKNYDREKRTKNDLSNQTENI